MSGHKKWVSVSSSTVILKTGFWLLAKLYHSQNHTATLFRLNLTKCISGLIYQVSMILNIFFHIAMFNHKYVWNVEWNDHKVQYSLMVFTILPYCWIMVSPWTKTDFYCTVYAIFAWQVFSTRAALFSNMEIGLETRLKAMCLCIFLHLDTN